MALQTCMVATLDAAVDTEKEKAQQVSFILEKGTRDTMRKATPRASAGLGGEAHAVLTFLHGKSQRTAAD
jgi:hypothetical protein